MDLAAIVDDELVQPLRGAIVGDDLVATGQLRDSVGLVDESTENKKTVHLVAMNYVLELRDGEQYKNPPTLEDIKNWLEAKGLDSVLDPYAVLATIQTEGTTWDKKGGSTKLQDILNKQNIKRVMDIAVAEETKKILSTKWRLR